MMVFLRQGEIREIGIEVYSKANQTFSIDAADYTVLQADGQQMDSGIPTIDGYRILTLFSAGAAGKYTVTFTYTIGAQKFMADVLVEVR